MFVEHAVPPCADPSQARVDGPPDAGWHYRSWPDPASNTRFAGRRNSTASRGHYPVVIAGAGPIGMAAARDLALRGIRSIVLDDDDKVSVGSRAICWARRTLEIFDRLGVARHG